MSIYTRDLFLPFPPPPKDELIAVMRAAVEAEVPVGEKLVAMLGNDNKGPDIDNDFSPCWRMTVTFETKPIEPLLQEQVD